MCGYEIWYFRTVTYLLTTDTISWSTLSITVIFGRNAMDVQSSNPICGYKDSILHKYQREKYESHELRVNSGKIWLFSCRKATKLNEDFFFLSKSTLFGLKMNPVSHSIWGKWFQLFQTPNTFTRIFFYIYLRVVGYLSNPYASSWLWQRSIFKRRLTYLNLEFSFSYTVNHMQVKLLNIS